MKSATKTFTGWVDSCETLHDVIDYEGANAKLHRTHRMAYPSVRAKGEPGDKKVRVTVTVEDI